VSDSKKPNSNQLIYQVLLSVPEGRVVTYGQVAQLCGLGRGARIVARALRNLPAGSKIPWYRVINARVINAQGRISIPGEGAVRQKERLESEGIVFLSGSVDLKKYQWLP